MYLQHWNTINPHVHRSCNNSLASKQVVAEFPD